MTLEQIREDLKDIRYYYSRKEFFDNAAKEVGKNEVLELVIKYNSIIKSAPPRLYDLYISLYVMNKTQEGLAIEMNYSWQNIALNCKNLVLYLQKEFEKKEENDG